MIVTTWQVIIATTWYKVGGIHVLVQCCTHDCFYLVQGCGESKDRYYFIHAVMEAMIA